VRKRRSGVGIRPRIVFPFAVVADLIDAPCGTKPLFAEAPTPEAAPAHENATIAALMAMKTGNGFITSMVFRIAGTN
jgi:hypothetical protein